MRKDTLKDNFAIFLVTNFLFGSSLLMGKDTSLKQNAWLAVIVGALIAIPIYLIYNRIFKLNNKKNLFEINTELLGPVGFIFNLLFIWYGLHLGAIVLRNFTEFAFMTLLNRTPIIFTSILMISTTAILIKGKIKAIGNWSALVAFIIIITISFSFLLSTSIFEVENLLPVFNVSISKVLKSSYAVFSFPYAEIVLILCTTNLFNEKTNLKKILFVSLGITTFIFSIITIRNITVMGPELMHNTAFKSVTASRIISLGQLLTGFEAVIVSNFIFSGIAKISICLLALSNGMTHMLKLSEYRKAIIPCTLIMLTLSVSLYQNYPQMDEFIKVYPIYSLPFQIIIPVIIWIASEIKYYKQKKLNITQPTFSISN